MDFMAHFTMGTGGHCITMLPADWSIFTSHDPLPSSFHSKKMLWNCLYHWVLFCQYICCDLNTNSYYSSWGTFHWYM